MCKEGRGRREGMRGDRGVGRDGAREGGRAGGEAERLLHSFMQKKNPSTLFI